MGWRGGSRPQAQRPTEKEKEKEVSTSRKQDVECILSGERKKKRQEGKGWEKSKKKEMKWIPRERKAGRNRAIVLLTVTENMKYDF